MSRLLPMAAAAAIAVTAAAWAFAVPAAAQIFGSTATAAPARYLVGRMGTEMPEADARHGIAFRPFAPPRRMVTVALLPPFHGDDIRANRGIGLEYADAEGSLYALSQWPANGGNLDAYMSLEDGDAGCPGARGITGGRKPRGIVWSTPHGLIMTLVSDGKNDDARALKIEWRKLIRRGVCR